MPVAPTALFLRFKSLLVLSAAMLGAVALAGWGQKASSPPAQPSIRFIVIDKIAMPMPAKLQGELDALDAVLKDPLRKDEHKDASRRRTALLTNYSRTEVMRFYGIVTQVGGPPNLSLMFFERADPVAVEIQASKAMQIEPGMTVNAYYTGKPRKDGPITFHKGLRIERLPTDIHDGLRLQTESGGRCLLSWRKAGRPLQLSVDSLKVGYLANTAYRALLCLRVHNKSGFPVIGLVRFTVRTVQGAHVADYSFLTCRPISDQTEVEYFGILPREYRSHELSVTMDTACVFEWGAGKD